VRQRWRGWRSATNALATELVSRCAKLDENTPGRRGVAVIVGWSLAAAVSIVAVVLFGLPLIADRLTPLVPEAFERRLGDVADSQIKKIFDAKVCENAAGQKAFVKLVTSIRESAGLDTSVQSDVLSSPIPNAFALPGGKVYLFDGLLAKADNADEIAGVLAHELGHLKHRDSMRGLIRDGSTSFLIGLLFGDITGSSALILRLEDAGDVVPIRARPRPMPTVLPSTSCTGWAGRRSRPGNCC